MDLNHLSAVEIARLIAQKKCTAVEVAEACLARIAARDKDVQAWEHIDREHVLAQARARDKEAPRGPLHGVPIGVKDVIDTYDMPTTYGSAIYEGHRPSRDAACVALLRDAGAVMLGKTVTVELAAFHYARTRNPHDLERTPAGSSSGSAAAVADGMVPLALANQTGGSTLRPASFCGVVGYKPTFNLINRAGMKPLAESQDTVGLIARSVPDVALATSILTGCAMPDFAPTAAPRVAFCSMDAWPRVEPAMAQALEDAEQQLSRGGARVHRVKLPQPFVESLRAQRAINDYEAYRAVADERLRHWTLLSSSMQERMTGAARVTYESYVCAQDVARQCRALLEQYFADHDVLLTPTTPGVAPVGLENTGDSNFIRIWTTFHTPTLSLPVFRGDHGLPMGLQVIGPIGQDTKTLGSAEWIYRTLT